MDTQFGMKELYDVSLKSTQSIEIDGKTYAAGEVLAFFDKVTMSGFQENVKITSVNGGHSNLEQLYWRETKEVNFSLVDGIFSKPQFALMVNANLLKPATTSLLVSKREELESDEDGLITLSKTGQNIFVYNASTGAKLTYTTTDNKNLTISTTYTDVIVDYQYTYTNTTSILTIGDALIHYYLILEGKTRVKDDITGQTHTGIIKIPKLKLMSGLSMRLGENASPLVGQLNAVALPTGARGKEIAMEIHFLEDDIDSDI